MQKEGSTCLRWTEKVKEEGMKESVSIGFVVPLVCEYTEYHNVFI